MQYVKCDEKVKLMTYNDNQIATTNIDQKPDIYDKRCKYKLCMICANIRLI